MKKIKAVPLSFIYAGCFLGAGFISGQELWQFFGSFGLWGYLGFCVSATLFVVFGMIMLRLTQMTGCRELEKLLVPWDHLKWLQRAAGIVAALFLFGVVIIMSAGVGAMGEQLFSVLAALGSGIFTAAVALVALLGVSGMVNAFSALVPVLVGATLLFGIAAWCKFDPSLILKIKNCNTNPLMPNWLIACLTYVAYNLLGSIGIMMPLGEYLGDNKRTVRVGILLGGTELVIVAGSILTSVASAPGTEAAQLPMVAVATGISPFLGSVYGILLMLGMFCNALASLVGLCAHMEQKLTWLRGRGKLYIPLMAVAVWLGSLFGFSDIVGVVFPVFGYVSVVFLATMVIHYIQERKRQK